MSTSKLPILRLLGKWSVLVSGVNPCDFYGCENATEPSHPRKYPEAPQDVAMSLGKQNIPVNPFEFELRPFL